MQFKTIYWWEWAHRFLGRLIGFGLPRSLPRLLGWPATSRGRCCRGCVGLFLLGGLQGAVGWYMVKSGLVDRIDVSQYRLAAHLGVAVRSSATRSGSCSGSAGRASSALGRTHAGCAPRLPPCCSASIYLQMLAGALVGGPRRRPWASTPGRSSTAPLCRTGSARFRPGILNLFENPLTVQFDHRMLGYTVVLASLAQAAWLAATA